jgi:short-subunit dehydrogenase
MSTFWNNKVVVITGASLGIGKTMARLAAFNGAQVVINARNEDRLQKVLEHFRKEGLSISGISGDVSQIEDVQKLLQFTLDQFGKVDILINNAGISHESDFDVLSPEVFKKVIDVNLLGSVYTSHIFLPEIKKTKGSIVFVGSVAGIHGLGMYSAYCASKMALTALAESLQIESKTSGIHFGIAYLGLTENDPDKSIYASDGSALPQPKRKVKQQPVTKVAQEILEIAEFRQKKKVISSLGKLTYVLNRISPNLVHRILERIYNKK